ncbi:MAG: HDIG domain-containing metalloprotein [bacterium]
MAKTARKTNSRAAPADEPPPFAAFLRDRRFLLAAAAYLLSCLILLYSSLGTGAIRAGDIAYKDYISPVTAFYTDTTDTEEARRKAAQKVQQVYRIKDSARTELDSLFQAVLKLKPESPPKNRDRLEAKLEASGLSQRTAEYLKSLDRQVDISDLRLKTFSILQKLAPDDFITQEQLDSIENAVAAVAAEYELPPESRAAIDDILSSHIARNAVKNAEATAKRKDESRRGVPDVKGTIRKDGIILRRGERVTQRHLDILSTLGLERRAVSWPRLAGILLLAALLFALAGAVLKNFHPRTYRNEKLIFIFLILVLITIASGTALTRYSGFLLGAPLGILGIAGGALLTAPVVIISAPLIACLLCLAPGLPLQHFIVAVAAAFAGLIFASRIRDRDALLKAGLAVLAASMITIAVISLLYFADLRQFLIDTFLFGALNGVIAFIVASGLIPTFEKIFNVTTPRRILELSNPEEPLLKRLIVEAPGTYHHSIFVGNLAETAADLVGADALLVRIAAYYHDIGKLKRPYFFAENQLTHGNQLVGVSPTLGSLVISSHTKDGVEMAKERGIPQQIIDLIPQHHGTCLISFFYQEAKSAAADGEEVPEDQFRYPGPKPQTLEAAILMIADSCEAAVRSLKEPSPKAVETQVNDIVRARLRDGQFDECDATLKQIDTIRDCMVRTLTRMYHGRIEYPKLGEETGKKQ